MLYSQSPDLWHVVEAGDQDAANVVVVECAVERRQMKWSLGEQTGEPMCSQNREGGL